VSDRREPLADVGWRGNTASSSQLQSLVVDVEVRQLKSFQVLATS
jgi:hypothetical protein